jgi:protein-tyrosine phosphatase
MTTSVFDLHTHVLPALDDGPADTAGAIELARAAVSAGTRVLVATPHIGTEHNVDPLDVPRRVADLEHILRAEGIPLELRAGGEIEPGCLAGLSETELNAIGLGGSRCLLLECPFTPVGDLMRRLVDHVHARGHRALLAHPERSPSLLRDGRRVEQLVEQGAFVQLTAASLEGRFGTRARQFAFALLEQGLAHVIASDAHDASDRPPELTLTVERAVREHGLPESVARYVLEDVPQALIEDGEIPESPIARRRFRQGLRGRVRVWR